MQPEEDRRAHEWYRTLLNLGRNQGICMHYSTGATKKNIQVSQEHIHQ